MSLYLILQSFTIGLAVKDAKLAIVKTANALTPIIWNQMVSSSSIVVESPVCL